MSNKVKDKNKPSIWHPIQRAEYNGSLKTYQEIQSRILPKDLADQGDIDLPQQWKEQPALYLLRGLGYGKEGIPHGSGVGLVQSPFSDIYTKIYGVTPLSDLNLYRKIYRSQPDVQNAIQMQVNLAVGKGFTISHKDKKVAEFITKLCDRINLPQHLPVMATDALVYGNSFTEIQWDDVDEGKEQIYEYQGENYTKNDLKKLEISLKEVNGALYKEEGKPDKNFIAQKIEKSKKAKMIIALKDLDPIYMRVRRDSYGNQFGFIQWLGFPPVLIDNESCIHIRNRPASWGFESAYGVSLLMPIIKNNDLLMQFENDASTWVHSRAVPPLIIKGGSPEKPYSTAQMTDLIAAMKSRTAATMIFTKGDVAFEEFTTIASDLKLDWWLNYLLLRRYQSLGVPPMLMGKMERGSGGKSAEVILHDFLAKLQVLQEFIADPIEEFIFRPLITQEFGEDVENAQIIWKPIIEESKDMRSQRLIQMVQAGIVTVNECRMEMGFERIAEPKYDKLEKAEPAGFSKGFPPKQGEEPAEPRKPNPDVERVVEQSKTPPESHMKMEEIKAKKMKLLQIDEDFRESLLKVTQKAKFELKNDAMLVKDVKKDFYKVSKNVIDEKALSSYLLTCKNETLDFDDTDLKPYQDFKDSCLQELKKNFENMVFEKEQGSLR